MNAPGGKTDFAILDEIGFTVHASSANPAIRDRENTVNQMLQAPLTRVVKLLSYLQRYTHRTGTRKLGAA